MYFLKISLNSLLKDGWIPSRFSLMTVMLKFVENKFL